MERQRIFEFCTWGGRRKGAGRKPAGQNSRVGHQCRPSHDARHPIHVTLRGIRVVIATKLDLLSDAARCHRARVECVLPDRSLHGAVESSSLPRRSRGLPPNYARDARTGHPTRQSDQPRARTEGPRLERPLPCTGASNAARGQKRARLRVGEPEQARRTRTRDRRVLVGTLFTGWHGFNDVQPDRSPLATSRTWLLRVGWRRSGPTDVADTPAASSRSRR